MPNVQDNEDRGVDVEFKTDCAEVSRASAYSLIATRSIAAS